MKTKVFIMDKIRIAVLILTVATVAAVVAVFMYKDIKSAGNEIAVREVGKTGDDGQHQAKIEEINGKPAESSVVSAIEPPDLTRKVVITAAMSEESKKQALEKIGQIIEPLKGDPNLFSNWVELGSYMKLIGDYDGAVVYWKYAAAIRPKSFIPLANLGDLYLHNIKDIAKAEKNYLTALMVGPDQPMVYAKLAELYRYFLKDDTKAKQVLRDGIDKNPSASERLKYILDNYENN